MSVTVASVLAILPAPPVAIAVTLAMVFVVLRVVFSVRVPVIAKMGTPGVVVAGRPPLSMTRAAVVVWKAVIITTARDSRVCMISMDGSRAAQQQACGEQGRLKQRTGFHESDSFLVFLMK